MDTHNDDGDVLAHIMEGGNLRPGDLASLHPADGHKSNDRLELGPVPSSSALESKDEESAMEI